jgi:hypothetical protein
MANGSGTAIFYKEVVDAIARNPPDVGDLHVLRDLCIAVDADNKPAVSKLVQDLLKLSGFEDPLHSISYELFHALLARMLLKGWFDEFDLMIAWRQSLFGTQNERVADNWDGIVKIVNEKPQSLGLLTRSNHEQEWKRALNGLEGTIRHFAEVRLPQATYGAPPIEPAYYERVLPKALREAIEQFFRVLQMLFQQILELALAELEKDVNNTALLRKLQRLQTTLEKVLAGKDKPPGLTPPVERIERVLNQTVRVAEFRYGRRGKQHRFLDAFPPHDARNVIFTSLDREDKDEPHVRGEKIKSIHISRDRQLGFYLATYGHLWDQREPPTTLQLRRLALIKGKHGGRLTLTDNDDFVLFLSNYFEDRLAELTSPGADALSKPDASVQAWRETVDLWSGFLHHLNAHSRLNLTEGPPNYLTHVFPRNIVGRLLHDCGVYAVRSAYTLLSVLDRINRLHSNIAGTVNARWVRLPLHVGLMIECSGFGLVVQHNEHAGAFDHEQLQLVRADWIANKPDAVTDPPEPDATLWFHEDLAANGFSSDLDMPVSSTLVLAAGEAVTTNTIWNSYQKKVVPSQLFTRVVGASNAPQYQFDIRYLRLSELEREWYNEYVLRFWNVDCNRIWNELKPDLTDPDINRNPAALAKNKLRYTDALHKALKTVDDSYKKQILPKKEELSKDLDDHAKVLLLPGIRVVPSVRIETSLPAADKVVAHISEVLKTKFKFPRDFVPVFGRPEEALLEVP